MLAFPVFASLGMMAPQLIDVLFGPQWVGAAAPFALLCAAGALKLLNTYAGAATQAAGLIWSEVWRQLLYIALIVGGIALFSPWGTTGAAFAVLSATFVMSVLMNILLQRVTHLRWTEILTPLLPALTCAAGSAVVVLAVEYTLRAVIGRPSAWMLVVGQIPAVALFVVLFSLFSPYKAQRALVMEVTDSLVPRAIKQHRWVQSYLNSPRESPEAGPV